MPVLTQGQTADLTFVDSDSVTIQAGSGTATFESPIGTVVAVFSGTRTFGPYSNRTGRVTATVQSTYYEFADGVGPTKPVQYQDGASPVLSPDAAGAVQDAVKGPIVTATTLLLSNDSTIGAGGWGVENGGTLAVESSNTRVAGRNVLRINGGNTGGVVSNVVRRKIANTAINGKLQVWVFIPQRTAGTFSLIIGYSSDLAATDPPTGSPTNRRTIAFGANQFKAGSWQCVTALLDGTATTNPNGATWTEVGSPNALVAQQLQISCTWDADVPTNERYLLVDTFGYGGSARPQILLWWDAMGAASHLTLIKPLLDRYGFKAAFSVDANLIAANKVKLDTLNAEGHDLVSEGLDHTNYGTNPAQIEIDYPIARAAMDAAGYTRARTCFAFPQNAWTNSVITYLRGQGIKLARDAGRVMTPVTNRGVDQTTPMGCLSLDQKSWPQVKAHVDLALANGESTILLGHNAIVGTPGSQDINVDVLESLYAYLASKQAAGLLDVVSPSSFLQRTASLAAK